MTIRDRRQWKQTADRRLRAASYPVRKLILIHSGVALAAALLVELLSYFLQQQFQKHTGLAGLQTRVILETAIAVLSVLYSVLTPFWSIGMTYAALRVARGRSAYPHTLPEGFRRFGPVLRLRLMQILIFSILSLIATYAASILFAFTPTGVEFAEMMEPLLLSGEFTDYTQLMEAIPPETMTQLYQVLLPITGVLLLALLTPAFYRMRMAGYVLMDQSGTGAWKAIRTSNRIMKGNGWQLLWLDLSYWWYYLVAALPASLLFVDLLPMAGIALPVEEDVALLMAYVAYAVLTLIWEVLVQPKRQTVYALTYDGLLEADMQQQSVQHRDVFGNTPQNEE